MENVPEVRAVLQGQKELLHVFEHFVYGNQPAVFRECQEHGERVKVLYLGPACPYCLTLDDLEFTREGRRY